ncbi:MULTISPECIES: hypothetical protein [unclassified Streptomyces]|uniref:hypothetical protein n=1 Tax=unclassified Streptomyces TaxID=2593676 RepID=UPI0036E20158
MNHLGDANLRTWTLRLTTLLAADPRDQLAWLDGRAVDTESLIDEVELLCRVCEGLTERGVFDPEQLHALRAVGHRLADIDTACRTGPWAESLTTDPTWDAVRPLARRFLVTTLGDWRQPLPASPRRGTD